MSTPITSSTSRGGYRGETNGDNSTTEQVDHDDSQLWQPSYPQPTEVDTADPHNPSGVINETGATGGSPAYEPKPITPLRKLTGKEQAFIKHLLDNPKATKTAAYLETYDHKGMRKTASEEASRTANKPQVKAALEANSHLFESVVVQTAKDWGNSDKPRERELALQASYWGHDKVHGKATQRTESTSKAVTLNIDLSGAVDLLSTGDVSATTSNPQG